MDKLYLMEKTKPDIPVIFLKLLKRKHSKKDNVLKSKNLIKSQKKSQA